MKANHKIIQLREALKAMDEIGPEIRYKSCVEAENFSSGLIVFRPHPDSDPKRINHRDKDVVCHVIKGRGRLRIDGRCIALRPGTICHIPKGTPHDFAAGKAGELLLFYSLIKTA